MDHVVSSIYKPVSLRGKTALVTGASAGIGKACAILLAEQGATVILVARRLAKLESVRQEIESLIPTATIHVEQCDIADVSSIKELAERLKSRQVDILVNNAGLALGTDSGDKVSVDDIETMFGTNVIGLMAMVSAFSPQMRARNSGEIVNIGSVAGSDHYAGGAIYCATKAAVEAYSNSLRMDLIDTNIRVIAINPGMVSGTEFSLVRFKGNSELASVPYKGLNCLTALDIADQVVYAVTRPLNVQIAQLKSYCNQQGHAKYAISRT